MNHLLQSQLQSYASSGLYPLHMPGHKRRVVPAPGLPAGWDMTEVPGVDDLHDADGILADAMARTAALWGAKRTWYLVNGSTCGILAAILLNSGAADYVITGCGTGEGAMLALNSFPGVICGHVEDPVDAYTFAHVNDGNAVSMPFAKGFGWGGELNLEYCFEKLFGFGHGQGYPKERVVPEMRNKAILDDVRAATFKPLIECLQSIDQDLLKGAIAGEKFSELFFASCKDEQLAAYIKTLL